MAIIGNIAINLSFNQFFFLCIMVCCRAYVLLGAPGFLHPAASVPTLRPRRRPREQWGAGRPRERGEVHCAGCRVRNRNSGVSGFLVGFVRPNIHVNDDHHVWIANIYINDNVVDIII